MPQWIRGGGGGAWMVLVGVALGLGTACGHDPSSPMPPPPPGPFSPEPDVATPIEETVVVRVDPSHPALVTDDRQPQLGPVTVEGGGARFRVTGRARTLPARSETLWVELFVENLGADGVRDLHAEITATDAAFTYLDLTGDPLAASADDGDVLVGGVAREGVASLALGLPVAAPSTFTVRLHGTTTRREARSSGPVQVTPDGREAWAVVPDADQVVVIDTASDRRAAALAVPGRPSGVAVTGDGALVLVTSSTANTLTIIDRATREIVQTFDEAAGIGREPRHVVASADGARAYVSSYVGDRVTVLERTTRRAMRVVATVSVGRRPLGLSLTGDGATLLVSHFLPRGPIADNEAWVSVVDTVAAKVDHEAVLRDDANLAESDCLAKVFGRPAEELSFEGSATQLAGVFLAPGGNLGWIPGLRFGPIPVWEVPAGAQVPGVTASRFAPAFVFYLDARDPRAVDFRRAPGVLDPPDANLGLLECFALRQESEFTARQTFPSVAGEQANTGAANPTGGSGLSETGVARAVGFTRGGRRALVVSYVADEIALVDAITQHPAATFHLGLSGANPTGIAVTPDGEKAYVVYESSLFASVLDLAALADPAALPPPSFVPFRYRAGFGGANSLLTRRTLFRDAAAVPARPPIQELGQIALVDVDPLPATRRRGRILFTSSNPDKHPGLTASRQAACATCHPDGGNDGSGWGTMEGERRTVALRGGVGGRGWLHQSGTHQDAEEFVRIVVPERLGGAGLTDEDYAALADYLAWGIPALQPPPVNAMLAARGAAVFAAACATCHAGERLTSGNPDPADPYGGGQDGGPLLFVVGTGPSDMHLLLPTIFTSGLAAPASELYRLVRGDRDLGQGDRAQALLGFRQRPDRPRGQVKAPSLVNVWDNVVFFHDGRFTSLADVVAYLDMQLGLGLDADAQRAVIEYLRTL